MSMKMQADINNLEAHNTALDQRLSEVEQGMMFLQEAIMALSSNDKAHINVLKIIKNDRMPAPRKPVRVKKKP